MFLSVSLVICHANANRVVKIEESGVVQKFRIFFWTTAINQTQSVRNVGKPWEGYVKKQVRKETGKNIEINANVHGASA